MRFATYTFYGLQLKAPLAAFSHIQKYSAYYLAPEPVNIIIPAPVSDIPVILC